MTVSIHRQIAKLQYVRYNTNDIDEDIDIILSDDNGDDDDYVSWWKIIFIHFFQHNVGASSPSSLQLTTKYVYKGINVIGWCPLAQFI